MSRNFLYDSGTIWSDYKRLLDLNDTWRCRRKLYHSNRCKTPFRHCIKLVKWIVFISQFSIISIYALLCKTRQYSDIRMSVRNKKEGTHLCCCFALCVGRWSWVKPWPLCRHTACRTPSGVSQWALWRASWEPPRHHRKETGGCWGKKKWCDESSLAALSAS